jgi:hypothetical protein
MTINIQFLQRNKKNNNAENLLLLARYLGDQELKFALIGFIALQKYSNFEGLENIQNKIKEDIIALVKKEELENFDEVINWINN